MTCEPCLLNCKLAYIDAFNASHATLAGELVACNGSSYCENEAMWRHRDRLDVALTDYWACLAACITTTNPVEGES